MLDNIFNSIDEKVRLEIEKIQDEQKGAILLLSKDYNQKCEQKLQKAREDLLRKSNQEVMEAQKKIETRFRFVVQETKHQILEEAYQEAVARINKLNEDDFRKIIVQMVEALPSDLTGQIKAGKRTALILRSLLPRSLVVSDDLDEEGFVAITSKMEIDFRISQIMKQNREKTDFEVLKILFA